MRGGERQRRRRRARRCGSRGRGRAGAAASAYIDFKPREATDPKVKSVPFNGVLSLLKTVDLDSATRSRVSKALNAQLTDPGSVAHFLSMSYQFLRRCCAENNADAARAARAAVQDIAAESAS
jgi:hypothetical protein